jgi:hypothetical protein
MQQDISESVSGGAGRVRTWLLARQQHHCPGVCPVLMQAKQKSTESGISMDLLVLLLVLRYPVMTGVAPLYGDGDENSKRTCTLHCISGKKELSRFS